MNKSQRMQLKAILILIALILLILLAFRGIVKLTEKKPPQGAYITREDATILAAAIEGQESFISEEGYLTYSQYCEILDRINTETAPQREAADDFLAKTRANMDEKYEEDFFVLSEDWYGFYDELLISLGLEEQITKETIGVLGVGSQVEDAMGDPLDSRQLLTIDTRYSFVSSQFMELSKHVLLVYKKENVLLTVRQVEEEPFTIQNVWIMEHMEEELDYFWNDFEILVPRQKEQEVKIEGNEEAFPREQIADLTFMGGELTVIKIKSEKVNGKLLRIQDGIATIEGVGEIPFQENFKIYKIYGKLEKQYTSDLKLGYDFADFVLENGEIAACLNVKDEAMENIRVLIKSSNYGGPLHEALSITADVDFKILYGDYGQMQEQSFAAGEVIDLAYDSEYFVSSRIVIEPSVLTGKIGLLSVGRSQGTPYYRGKIEVMKNPDGLSVINEVLLEEYLYSVVPSEMPASYPLEALKAQAICARTYAYRNMLKSGLPQYGAHVDDSAGYQVYNNIKENGETTKAVRETQGQLIYYGDGLAAAFYYSTSCGFGTNSQIWKSGSTEDFSYLQAQRIETGGMELAVSGQSRENTTATYNKENMTTEEVFGEYISNHFSEDFESNEGWYRWTYHVQEINVEKMCETLKKRYETNSKLILTRTADGWESTGVNSFSQVQDIYVEKRNDGGVIDELVILTDAGEYKVITEHNVRYVLNDGITKVVRQDGSEIEMSSLLPSAFFVIEVGKEGDTVVEYKLTGGGFGHGVGMSQNGARSIAGQGYNSTQIIEFFYQNCKVREVY